MKHVFVSDKIAGYSWLEEIIRQKADVEAIITKKDTKSCDKADFSRIAKENYIPLYSIENINHESTIKVLKEIKPDVMWVLAWSQLLKKEAIKIPSYGCIGSHPTKLPLYRGGAPLAWTILKGLEKSALTFFWLEEGIDTGDIICQKEFDIAPNETSTSLNEKVINLGKEIIKEYLPLIEQRNAPRIKQNQEEFREYWPRRTYKDQEIDFSKSPQEINRLIRASHLYGGAYFYQNNKKIIVLEGKVEDKK